VEPNRWVGIGVAGVWHVPHFGQLVGVEKTVLGMSDCEPRGSDGLGAEKAT